MKLEEEIIVNKYGQGLISIENLLDTFNANDVQMKRAFLTDMTYLILQSKVKDSDIQSAIEESKLKPTFTPCVLLTKGVATYNLNKILNLPENELNKVLILFSSLFKIGYQRRFNLEKNNPNKWWYWDLSDDKKIKKIIKDYY